MRTKNVLLTLLTLLFAGACSQRFGVDSQSNDPAIKAPQAPANTGGGDADGFTGVRELRAYTVGVDTLGGWEIEVIAAASGERRAKITRVGNDGSKLPSEEVTVARTQTASAITYQGDGFEMVVDLTRIVDVDKRPVRVDAERPKLSLHEDMVADDDIDLGDTVLLLDAARANASGAPYATGCASTDLTWYDLSPYKHNGVVNGLIDTNCATAGTGWAGNGSTASPYRINMGGNNDLIQTGSIDMGDEMTVLAWISLEPFTHFAPIVANMPVAGAADVRNGFVFGFDMGGSNGLRVITADGAVERTTSSNKNLPTLAPNGWTQWAQVGVVMNKTSGQLKFYYNGVDVTDSDDQILKSFNSAQGLDIGFAVGMNGGGKMSIVQVYKRALPQSEIHNLCVSEQSRFGTKNCK